MDEKQKKREEKLQKILDNEYTIKMTKREWIAVYNSLAMNGNQPRMFSLGESRILLPIMEKIYTVADLKPLPEDEEEKEEEGVVIN